MSDVITHHEPIQINSFADLFSLYGKLVAPVTEYERIADHKQSAEEEIEKAKMTISSAWLMPFAMGIARALMFAIPFVILFLIICNVKSNAEGVKWIQLYDVWYGKLWLVEQYNQWVTPESVPLWLGIVLNLIHFLLIEHIVAPVVLFLIPITTTISGFTTIFTVIQANRIIQVKQNELVSLEEELQARIDYLQVPISFVPPDYRSSEAIEYFYRSYANGKVQTLQEATVAFDNYMHQKRMEQGQQDLLVSQNAILREISYQTTEISKLKGKLDTLNSKVGWF